MICCIRLRISLRPAESKDFAFAHGEYVDMMRWIIERFFDWDQAHEEESSVRFFRLEEVPIAIADRRDVGWVQERSEDNAIFLCSRSR